MGVRDLDIARPEFLPIEILMFRRMLEKYEQYLFQGRDLEAAGVSRAIGIAFSTLKGEFEYSPPSAMANL